MKNKIEPAILASNPPPKVAGRGRSTKGRGSFYFEATNGEA